MKETYLSRDFRETAAQCFPSQAKELNAFFDARLNVLLESDLSRVFSPKLSSEQTKKQKGLLFTAITSPFGFLSSGLHNCLLCSYRSLYALRREFP